MKSEGIEVLLEGGPLGGSTRCLSENVTELTYPPQPGIRDEVTYVPSGRTENGLQIWNVRIHAKDDYTIIPIVVTGQHIVGELRILTSVLPATPDFVFSIGFQALEANETPAGDIRFGRYELREATILTDDQYVAYLRQTEKL